jgi:hypothetical protein
MKENKEITLIVNQILNNEIGIIEAARQITKIRAEGELFDGNLLDIFRGIESETDHLVLGNEKFMISKEREEFVRSEIQSCEDFYRDDVKAVCDEILKRI